MNSAVTFSRIKNVDAGSEGDAAVVAPRTFRAAGDILRTIIGRVFVKWVRRRRWNSRFVVGPPAESLGIGARGRTPRDKVCPGLAVVIRGRGVARAGGALHSKDTGRLTSDEAGWVEARV